MVLKIWTIAFFFALTAVVPTKVFFFHLYLGSYVVLGQ